MRDIPVYVSCKFEMYILKIARVISENVRIAFLFVLSIFDIDIRNSTIVRCHSNAVLVRSIAVNHNHPTLWSTMCLTIRCDQALKINSSMF